MRSASLAGLGGGSELCTKYALFEWLQNALAEGWLAGSRLADGMCSSPLAPPAGFVLVKKVPGALHFVARSPGHSFDYLNMNLSHLVHYLYYGNRPSPRCAHP